MPIKEQGDPVLLFLLQGGSMGKNYGLTDTEAEIMEMLWQSEEPLPFKAIMEVAEHKWMKSWKKQTLNTYLINMQRVGFIGVDKSGTRNAYYALFSREELVHRWTKKMVKQAFGGSVADLLVAFTGGKKLSPEDAEQIKKLI